MHAFKPKPLPGGKKGGGRTENPPIGLLTASCTPFRTGQVFDKTSWLILSFVWNVLLLPFRLLSLLGRLLRV